MKRLMPVAFCFLTILAWQMALTFSLQSPSSFIYIIVHSRVHQSIGQQLDQYLADLQQDGLNAEVREYAGGNAEDIRSILKEAYPRGLVGALLIGDIPSAQYEMDVSYPLQPQITHQEFPMDLFYMDLDGVWKDTDGNGKYDVHTGNRAPEIWVGRLKASNMAEDEVSLLQNYFFKNHAYRNGILKLPERALIYIDDFWAHMARDYDSAVSLVFANRTIVSDRANTNPKDYLNRLRQGWTLVHLFVHGGSTSHHFYVNNVEDEGQVYSSDMRQIDPQALFYILISCWNAQYTARDYMGGWYIFTKTYGLVAISSTKPGDMQGFREFYTTSGDKDIGTAFREWFVARIKDEDAGNEYTKKYFYGLIIIGDPTLHMKPSHYLTRATATKATTSQVTKITSISTGTTSGTITTTLGGPAGAPDAFTAYGAAGLAVIIAVALFASRHRKKTQKRLA